MNFSKTTWLIILLIIFIIAAGIFAYQWWQVKGELAKKIEQNENLTKQVDELQAEIKELKTAQVIGDGTIEDKKAEVTITTDKAEYRQGETVKIVIKNNSDEKTFSFTTEFCSLGLQEYENGKWKTIEGIFEPRCCPCGAMCEIRPRVYIASGEIYEVEWDQIIDWCDYEPGIEITERTPKTRKETKTAFGKYRFLLNYQEKSWEITYSNAFVIK